MNETERQRLLDGADEEPAPIPCPECESDDTEIVDRDGGMILCRCLECGIHFEPWELDDWADDGWEPAF